MAEVAAKIPIREYIDYGDSVETNQQTTNFLQNTYAGLHAKAKRTVVKPGDKIAVAGLEWRIVQSGGQPMMDRSQAAEEPIRIAPPSNQQLPTLVKTHNPSAVTSRSEDSACCTWVT
jgi:hypothetical protein